MNGRINVAFAGNPNCGKTTLFNALTGARLKVANWPGVTVEKMEGTVTFHDCRYTLVDLPGTYSLTSYTMEEIVARNYVLSDEADVIVNVVDASALERNLYLTLQLIELGKPVVMALNMMDVVRERHMEIDLHRLPEMLGIPVIPVSARRRSGLNALMHAVAHHVGRPAGATEHHHEEGEHRHDHHSEYVMVYSDPVEDKLDILIGRLTQAYPDIKNPRWHAIKLLEGDGEIRARYPVRLDDVAEEGMESRMVNEKYAFIEEVVAESVSGREEKSASTDRADRLLTHPVWGLPVFFLIMAAVFFLTFTVGDFLKEYFVMGLDYFSGFTRGALDALGVAAPVISLVVDGVIAGVGGILTFLPNIVILFLALAFLEDSGYMSRVAYIMDGIMGRIGLSGRAFLPMLLGFGCTVPAVMASRALEDRGDRLKTILVTPFMSCSARLPVYVLLSQMFFGQNAFWAAYSMYLIGIIAAIAVAFIVDRAGGRHNEHTLLIELPEYKSPNARTVRIYVWNKVKDYLTKAGTTIFIASILLWFLLNLGPGGLSGDISQSFGAMLGRLITPLMAPAGLGYWQIVVALIAGISAKEVVVSSLGVLYSISNISSQAGMAQLSSILGGAGFTALNAYCMMLFCLLYVPCVATIATIRRETGSRRWTLAAVGMQLGVAWVVSTLVYQIGRAFMG